MRGCRFVRCDKLTRARGVQPGGPCVRGAGEGGYIGTLATQFSWKPNTSLKNKGRLFKTKYRHNNFTWWQEEGGKPAQGQSRAGWPAFLQPLGLLHPPGKRSVSGPAPPLPLGRRSPSSCTSTPLPEVPLALEPLAPAEASKGCTRSPCPTSKLCNRPGPTRGQAPRHFSSPPARPAIVICPAATAPQLFRRERWDTRATSSLGTRAPPPQSAQPSSRLAPLRAEASHSLSCLSPPPTAPSPSFWKRTPGPPQGLLPRPQGGPQISPRLPCSFKHLLRCCLADPSPLLPSQPPGC